MTPLERKGVPEHPFGQLSVPPDVYDRLVAQARSEAPLECCGLLAGHIRQGVGVVEACYPLVNDARSPVEFVSDARSMFDAVRAIDRRGLVMLAVYHSHPTTPPVPSKTDLERSYSPDMVNVIVSLQLEPPLVKAWWFHEREYRAAALEVTGADSPANASARPPSN